MALVIADRVQETTNTTGTGTLTLAGALSGYQTFLSGIGNSNTTYYTIVSGTDWEVGIGTYTSSGNTFSRDTILASSNSNTAITVSAGAIVFGDYPAGRAVTTENVQSLSNKTLTGTKETVYTITDGAAFEIDPANGGIQSITLGASRTPQATNFTAGQSVTLMITASSYTLTWTDTTFGSSGVKWIGTSSSGSAPTLSTSAITIVEFWKTGTQVYGALVGIA